MNPPTRKLTDDASDDDGRPPARRRRNEMLGSDVALGPDEVGRVTLDRLEPFAPAIVAVRWATLVASLGVASGQIDGRRDAVLLICGALGAYTVARTMFPVRDMGDRAGATWVLGELSVVAAAVLITGSWESPFVLALLASVVVCGFARGLGFALIASGIAVAAFALADLEALQSNHAVQRIAGQQAGLVLLVAVVAGYARRISGLADERQTLALDRMGRLADANSLLHSLHRITQMLPASLDLDGVLDTTMSRLRSLLDVDAAAMMLFDDTDGHWQVVRSLGTRLPERLGPTELPPPLRMSLTENAVVSVGNLLGPHGPGLNARTSSGVYATLEARGAIIGLLAIEHPEPDHYEETDTELLTGFVRPVALAIDNARWFSRIRTVGADEERTRIARDLHDRIGQSLAYLAMELDRLERTYASGRDIAEAIDELRDDVRTVVSEVRETLYDLRTDVSDDRDLPQTLQSFVARVEDRSGLAVTLDIASAGRLPILQEREMWRIAQEALTNVERHADASTVKVSWTCDGLSAQLRVADDGRGFQMGESGRIDSYGLVGMRERAASIGAALDIESHVGAGTVLSCKLDRPGDGQQIIPPFSTAPLPLELTSREARR